MNEEKFPYHSSDTVFTENKLDNKLIHEFLNKKIDKEKIHSLLAQGANIHSIDSLGNSLLMNIIACQDYNGVNLDAIQFLIDLGIDINYTDDEGTNCLYIACLSQSAELVEFLLKAGVNPNCNFEPNESLLDWADFDQWFCATDYGKESGERMQIIVELLIKYGAKHSKDL
jgi:ankyrin repeat protein